MQPSKTFKTWTLVCAIAVLASSACTPDQPTRAWTGSIQDSLGVRVVHNPDLGLWCEGQEWILSDALTIGSDVGDPNYEFGKITGIQVGALGQIFVFDQMAGEIREFDAQGTHVRSSGRRGKGPGEFGGGAVGIFLSDDDRLTIPDLGNQRVTWMGLNGEVIGSMRATYANGFPVRWDGDATGAVMVQRRAMGGNEDPDLAAGDPLVRIDRDGAEKMVTLMPLAETVWMEENQPRFRYFATEPSWDLGPSGTLRTAMTQDYRIALWGANDSVHTVISKGAEPRAVTDEDKAHFEGLLRDALTRMEVAPASAQRQIDRLYFGPTFPAFNRIMEGPEGTTVVQQVSDLSTMESLDLSEERSRRLGSRNWDVFEAEGRFLGTIELPARFSPMVWQSDAVYGKWLDDLDRNHVRKLNLVRGDGVAGEGCR